MKRKTAILAALCALSISVLSAISTYADNTKLLAFPEAVGGGKYTEGARAAGEGNIEVYHVTNLKEKGEGSFADAVSKEGRIIVFDVGGVIELKSTLKINKSNLTILGQTAPGDGITFMGGDISISDGVKNVIIRYIRVRPTDKNGGEPDALGGRWNKNIILDHCSMSWSVDEGMTLYAGYAGRIKDGAELARGSNLTVQNCLSAESLRMSNHVKGAHGYGAIVGALDSTWVYNLFAHHDSRSPRVDAAVKDTEFANNVIYNWGITNSAYGAQPEDSSKHVENPSTMNWMNNYYKYGPGTKDKLKSRIFEVSNEDTKYKDTLQFYFNGNYVWNDSAVTDNNTQGVDGVVDDNDPTKIYASLRSEKNKMTYNYEPVDAETAYKHVLENAGATLPKRDAVDARIIADVENHTGRIINSADEVGGWIPVETVVDKFEIPSKWIAERNLGGYKPEDIIKEEGEYKGYTLIEAYVNEWTAEQQNTAPSNPEITVLSPVIAAINEDTKKLDEKNWLVTTSDKKIPYSAMATAVGGYDVTKMELYDGNKLLETYDGNSINDNISLEPGVHYLTCRAYNENGEKTQSPTSIVYVNSTAGMQDFNFTTIGTPTFADNDKSWFDESTGMYTIAGSGSLFGSKGAKTDSGAFMYKELDGNFDITVRIEDIPKFENYQISGLMVRESLEKDSAMWMLADGWIKNGENVRVISRAKKGDTSTAQYFTDGKNTTINNDVKNYDYEADNSDELLSYDTSHEAFKLPKYMRIQRDGNTLTFYVSNSGTDWHDNIRQPITITYNGSQSNLYVGLAVDSAQGTPTKEYFAQAKFSEVTINGKSVGETVLRPVSEPTKWVFDSYVNKDITKPVLLGDHIKVHSNASMSIAENTKTINKITYTSTLKFGGTGKFDAAGNPVSRVVEIIPESDGILEVAFLHASKEGTRYLYAKQGNDDIAAQAVEPGNDGAYLSCKVTGGKSVYLYSTGVNIYAIYYIPTEVSSPYVSFVSASASKGKAPFDQSHIKHNDIRLLRYGSDDEGKGGTTYGNTISTGFTSSVKNITGVSYDTLAWDITIPVGDTYVKVPHGTDMNALMLSDMIDPGEYYIPDIDYNETVSEEIIVGEEQDFLDWGEVSQSALDWEITDISAPSDTEINVSEELSFTDEQLLEFAEFADSANGYRASSWDVSIGVEDDAELTDTEEVELSSRGAIYKVTSVDGDTDEKIQIQLRYSTKTVFTGESTVTVGLVIDNLYAPSANATVMYYEGADNITGYQDLNEKAITANSYEEYLNQNS